MAISKLTPEEHPGPSRGTDGRFAPGDAPQDVQIARFWSHVEKTDGCWLWRDPSHEFGYGQMRWMGRCRTSHAVSWEIHNGPIPRGQVVCHNCPTGDNPACVRPDHLFLGPQRVNMADMRRKGRGAQGERHGNATISDATVAEILAGHAAGESVAALARRFGISYYHSWAICRRKTRLGVKGVA